MTRNINIGVFCCLCNEHDETINNIFLQCYFARAVCFCSELAIRTYACHTNYVTSWIRSCLQTPNQSPRFHLQLTCPISIIQYSIQYVRNQAIFSNIEPDPTKSVKLASIQIKKAQKIHMNTIAKYISTNIMNSYQDPYTTKVDFTVRKSVRNTYISGRTFQDFNCIIESTRNHKMLGIYWIKLPLSYVL